LAARQHLENWLGFLRTNSDNLSEIGHEAGILADHSSTKSVVRWAYTNAASAGAQGWIKSAQYESIDDHHLQLLK
jgi:hypothetical protein